VKKKVAILSSGSDSRKNRGYANSSLNLFFNLQKNDHCIVHFYKGDGKQDKKNNTYVVKNFGKQKWVHRKGNKIGDTFVYEYIIFALCFLFFNFFRRRKYDAIYTQEPRVSKTLYQLRFLLPGKPLICFGMGVSMDPEHYINIADRIQIVNLEHYENAVAQFPQVDKFRLIPNLGSSTKKYIGNESKKALREQYGVKTPNVLISIGAINKKIKRMDYIVDEAILLSENWTLVLVGHNQDKEIVEKAEQCLGGRFIHLFVSPDKIPELYYMSDVAALASYYEGFPNVVLEASQNKIAPILHDCKRNRWILKDDMDYLVDMSEPRALSSLLNGKNGDWFQRKGEKAESLYNENYSWSALEPKYLELLNVTEKCA
jgi:glycosyltransferase involved in cell wall biosynthesis